MQSRKSFFNLSNRGRAARVIAFVHNIDKLDFGIGKLSAAVNDRYDQNGRTRAAIISTKDGIPNVQILRCANAYRKGCTWSLINC